MSGGELLRDYEFGSFVAPAPGAISCRPNDGFLCAGLPVPDLAIGAVAAFAASVNRLLEAGGLEPRTWHLDPERIAASYAGDAMMRVGGEPVAGFSSLSGFFAAADGWVRTHANYPHHRDRLLAVLDLPTDAGVDALAERISRRGAAQLEDDAAEVGALAVRVRTEQVWQEEQHPERAPLVTSEDGAAGEAPEIPFTDRARPLRGVKVLDLTRVLAGPVAGRSLALLGADVLRVDPPHLAEVLWQHRDTGHGKRSTLIDLASGGGRRQFAALLEDADVLLTGYRPGALDRFGVPDDRPGLVHGRVSAWDPAGPWGRRRGFDSLVQAATGIARIEGNDDRPGALPVQALDHASGYLLAAAVIDALSRRVVDGRGCTVGVVLEHTARWLLGAPGRMSTPPSARVPGPATTVTHGDVLAARPALAEYDDYPFPARPWGKDEPRWA